MATGLAPFSANFDVRYAAALDARRNAAVTKADLILPATWTAGDGGIYVYKGIDVVISSDGANNGLYVLTDPDFTNPANWLFVGSGGLETPTTLKHSFYFGDISPSPVFTALPNVQFSELEITITTPFDGEGALLSVGDSAQHNRLISATDNAPSEIGRYLITPNYVYSVDTQINLYITPGTAATTGSGILTIRY